MSQENGVEVEELKSHTTDESGPVTVQESPSTESQSSNILADDQRLLPLQPRKATGPRTVIGKQRSSRNSNKHGIFSSALLIRDEDAKLFHSLLKHLAESLDPHGMLESLLVEKLATIVWRHRRLLQAESAEIRKNIDTAVSAGLKGIHFRRFALSHLSEGLP